MTIFEYILVLLSMVLGLAVTQLASGVGELLRSRHRVTWSLPYALWLAFSFLAIMDLWTSGWLLRNSTRWTLWSIGLLLGSALSVYLAALWLIPRDIGDEDIDLGTFLLQERRYFLGALLAYSAFGIMANLYLFPNGYFDWATYATAAPVTATLALPWWSPNRWVQLIAPIAGLTFVVTYFAVYFPTIG